MERTIRLILEMVITGIVIIFLLSYFFGGRSGGENEIWSRMQAVEVPENDCPDLQISKTAARIISEEIPAVWLKEESCSPNKSYLVQELFGNSFQKNVYLELVEVYLEKEQVLARGNIQSLMQEENAAAALYEEKSGTLLFTRQGNYQLELIVGTQYGRKPCRRIRVMVPVISGEKLKE